jgi:hypothetical protein
VSAAVRLVVQASSDPEQAIVKTHPDDLTAENHDEAYVRLSGYCGPYSPQLFAAAPELLQALQSAYDALCISYPLHSVDMDKRAAVLAAARDAMAEATRQPSAAPAQLEAA